MRPDLGPRLNQFCQQINSEAKLRQVPVCILPGAKTDFCFGNVHYCVNQWGGALVTGWQFCHLPVDDTAGCLAAVHHAVWLTPEILPFELEWKESQEPYQGGNLLVDVTPPPDEVLSIGGKGLFLDDPTATKIRYEGDVLGLTRSNKVFPLSNNPKVLKYVRDYRAYEYKEWRQYERWAKAGERK